MFKLVSRPCGEPAVPRVAIALTVAAAVVCLSGCGLSQMRGWSDAPTAATIDDPVVHAAAISRDRAVIWVASNGCTVREDLKAVVQRRYDGPTLTLVRTKPDDCATPQSVEMIWTFDELGLEPGAALSVTNAYRLPPG